MGRVSRRQGSEDRAGIHLQGRVKTQVLIVRKPVKEPREKHSASTSRRGSMKAPRSPLKTELPSSILLHDGWLYVSGQGTVAPLRQTQPAARVTRRRSSPRDFAATITIRSPGFDHRQNDGWLYNRRRRQRQLRRRLRRQPGHRAAEPARLFRCRPTASSACTLIRSAIANPYRRRRLRCRVQHVPRRQRQRRRLEFTGLPAHAHSEGVDSAGAAAPAPTCCIPDFTRAAISANPGQGRSHAQNGTRFAGGLPCSTTDLISPRNIAACFYYPDVFRKVVAPIQVAPQGADLRGHA